MRPHTKDELERHLYRLIAGQVRDYIGKHPEHVSARHKSTMPVSIAKRIVGDLLEPGTRRELRRKGF